MAVYRGGALLWTVAALLLTSFSDAQWDAQWIIEPPQSSAAYGKVNIFNVTGTSASGTVEENVATDSVLAVLRYQNAAGAPSMAGCNTKVTLANFTSSSCNVVLNSNVDFESGPNNGTCRFTIAANATISQRSIDFSVVDLNDNPPKLAIYPTSFEFNESISGEIHDFDATDADAIDAGKLKYILKVLSGDSSYLKIDEQTGKLTTDGLDYEKTSFFLFQITVKDSGNNSIDSNQITLRVKDRKDTNPMWTAEVFTIHIQEELKQGTEIFSVRAQDGDVQINDTIVYSLQDPSSKFAIDNTTGAVRIVDRIDRDSNAFVLYYELDITATCKNYPTFQSHTLSTVFVDDINDNVPLFDAECYGVTVDEGFTGRLSDLEILVSDPDLNAYGSYSVRIEGSPDITQYLELSPTSGRNNGSFFIKINSSKLLDYENDMKSSISFLLVATETANNTHTSTSNVTICSKDINDNAPKFNGDYQANVFENQISGSYVTTVQASDIDKSPEFGNASIRYSFLESFEAARYFSINDTTGEIRTVVANDRESIATSPLNYTIVATDNYGAADGLRTTARVAIRITDINDEGPQFSSLSVGSFSVSEGDGTGKEITNVTATDRDLNPNLILSINWDNSKFYRNRILLERQPEWTKSFILESVQGKTASPVIGKLKVGDSSLPPGDCNNCNNTPLDREIFDSVELCLTVIDNNTASSYTNKDEVYIAVNILDVNDNNPKFLNTVDFEFVIEEEKHPQNFGSVLATDADSNTIRYSINCSGVAINPTTGALSTTEKIDHEKTSTIDCIVTATDNGEPPRSTNTQINISVTDINDNLPVWSETIPVVKIIDECSSTTTNGTLVVTLKATDADSGVYGNVSYLFSKDNTEGEDEFAIDLVTGDITVKNCKLLDSETKTFYSLLVEARDNYRENIISGSQSNTRRINITLNDVNDNAPTLPKPTNGCDGSVLESAPMNELAASILGSDRDEQDSNKWMTFELISQGLQGNVQECMNLFRIETVNNSIGQVVVDVENIRGCLGDYSVTVNACDRGKPAPLCSNEETYRICIQDINDNAPQFIFPTREGSIVEVLENSSYSTVNDQVLQFNGTQPLVLKATDQDNGTNSQILYTWRDGSVNDVFFLDPNTGEVFLKQKLDRSVKSSYDLDVVATDQAQAPNVPQKDETKLRINVRLSDKRLPYFSKKDELLNFKENVNETVNFQNATDVDNQNLYPGETPYDVCYYITNCGNTEYFAVPEKRKPQLATKKILDNEAKPSIRWVGIYTSNDCTNTPEVVPCADDTPQYLNVSIQIIDENDCSPVFSGSRAGGILAGDDKGKKVFQMDVTDQDENESITCQIQDEFTFSDDSLKDVPRPPFIIDKDYNILLQFTVQSSMKGFFKLNVTCNDKVSHSTTKAIKIYVITSENQLDITFMDPVSEVESKRQEIEDIFSTKLGYLCNVESVLSIESDGSTRTAATRADNATTSSKAVSHFIDEVNDEPVKANVIISMTREVTTENELISSCGDAGLVLVRVGPTPDPEASTDVFKILFYVTMAIVVLATGVIGYLLYNRYEVSRMRKAMNKEFSGSKDSGLDNPIEAIPGTNEYAGRNTNPMFTMDPNSKHDDNFDSISESSGDSVLIGVENDPEFAYNKPRSTESSPELFRVVHNRNPLFLNDEDSVPQPNYPPPPPPARNLRLSKRPAPAPPTPIEEEEQESESSTDLNFSFGDVTMTAV